MDIKWNDMIKKIVRGIQQKTWNKEIFLAILVIGMLEFALFVGLLRGSYSTGTVWIVGFLPIFCWLRPFWPGRRLFWKNGFRSTKRRETGF